MEPLADTILTKTVLFHMSYFCVDKQKGIG